MQPNQLEKTLRKVIIDRNNTEHFTKSNCKCKVCSDMNAVNDDFKKWVPKTRQEQNYKNMVERIEQKYK